MDRCGSPADHPVVFDPSPDKSRDEKPYRREVDREGRRIVVWGMWPAETAA